MTIYGKEEIISFLCLDLLWGQGLYQELRFVLVQHGDRLSILVSTGLALDATVVAYLRQSFFRLFAQNPNLALTPIIRSKQKSAHPDVDSLAS